MNSILDEQVRLNCIHVQKYWQCTSQGVSVQPHMMGHSTGQGVHFIPHSELGYNRAINCQYLVNNCLYFRVKVATL